MADSSAVISVREATKRYGGVYAVRDISFDLRHGEILGLIGPNGAGKTTLVNMITGMTHPTSGSITFEGTSLNSLSPHAIGRLGISRTFQVMRPFANLSVLENVAVGAMFGAGGQRRSTRAAFQRAEEVLEQVHLWPRRDDPADSLPVGSRKRLELARALAMDPRVLLLDEVMAGLRGAEVDEAMDLIREIHAGGVTLLVIEHVMKVILGLCSRVVVLDYGRKIAEGTSAEVTHNPAVVQAYLGRRYQADRADAEAEAASRG